MSAADWPLLDPAEEDALHLTRLLSVDERPFQRITRRLQAKDALIHRFPVQLPTPPPDGGQDDQPPETDLLRHDGGDERRRYHDEILLDFAQLESTLIRIQFLKDANERERARYAEEKSKILATAEAIRVNTAELRVQLVEAERSLALKKEYDVLAEDIFKDRALKSRDVLQSEGDRLRAEIEDLDQEGRDFAGLWAERRERFERVVGEGRALMKFLKGEKVDEQLGEEGEIECEEEGDTKDVSSTAGTPRTEADAATPVHGDLHGEEAALAAQQTLAQRALGPSLKAPTTHGRAASSASSTMGDTDATMGAKDTAMGDKDTTMDEEMDLETGDPIARTESEADHDGNAPVVEDMDTT